ncbi:hypothetical protein BDZ89DRAFT_1127443 [Hymenopellis radicata]|nr:hypothetical protein BDZ89DRAFT_1127443 [Hymenopellis radicata]
MVLRRPPTTDVEIQDAARDPEPAVSSSAPVVPPAETAAAPTAAPVDVIQQIFASTIAVIAVAKEWQQLIQHGEFEEISVTSDLFKNTRLNDAFSPPTIFSTAVVIRDGQPAIVPSKHVVPGPGDVETSLETAPPPSVGCVMSLSLARRSAAVRLQLAADLEHHHDLTGSTFLRDFDYATRTPYPPPRIRTALDPASVHGVVFFKLPRTQASPSSIDYLPMETSSSSAGRLGCWSCSLLDLFAFVLTSRWGHDVCPLSFSHYALTLDNAGVYHHPVIDHLAFVGVGLARRGIFAAAVMSSSMTGLSSILILYVLSMLMFVSDVDEYFHQQVLVNVDGAVRCQPTVSHQLFRLLDSRPFIQDRSIWQNRARLNWWPSQMRFSPLRTTYHTSYAILQSRTIPLAVFSLISLDGDQGYPGTLTMEVLVALLPPKPTSSTTSDMGRLIYVYRAKVDKDVTPINLTQHWGFNLDASLKENQGADVKGHVLKMKADRITSLDGDGLRDNSYISVANAPVGRSYQGQEDRGFVSLSCTVGQSLDDQSLDLVGIIANKVMDLLVELSSETSGLAVTQSGAMFYANTEVRPEKGARKKIHGGSGITEHGTAAAFLEFHDVLAPFLKPENKDGDDTLLTKDEVYNNYVQCDVTYVAPKK